MTAVRKKSRMYLTGTGKGRLDEMSMQIREKRMTRRERELLKRCLVLMAGSVFFFIMAAIRAWGGDYYTPPQRDQWAIDDETDYDVMADDDHIMAWRLNRQVVGARPVYSRRKSSRIHDSVTIVINESTASEIASSNDIKGDASMNMTLTSWLTPKLSGGLGTKQQGAASGGNSPTIQYSKNRAHKSDSTIERTQSFQSTLTGKVIDVQRNGYLVVEAKKTLYVNTEEQTLILTGIVNPDHMDSTSSVNAEKIIDMSIRYVGKGQMSKEDTPKWGAKIIDFLTPF